jgi:transcription elongation GreA/GreB family factor
MDQIKKELIIKCRNFVGQRMQTIGEIMSSNQKALQSETKSSAGDKHETGRAMLQLEMEKASLQLESVNTMKETLDKINFHSISDISKLGSLVMTSSGNYFLAISSGKIEMGKDAYYAVSLSSPIGKNLFGTKQGDEIDFNGKKIKILKVF